MGRNQFFTTRLNELTELVKHACSVVPNDYQKAVDDQAVVLKQLQRSSDIEKMECRAAEEEMSTQHVMELIQQERSERLQKLSIVHAHLEEFWKLLEDFEKMVLAQDRALTEKTRAIDVSTTQYLDRGINCKENSFATLKEEVEMAHAALAQTACLEGDDHNLQIGLDELHEKADMFTVKIDDITRRLWDAIETHSHDARMDAVGEGDSVHVTQLDFQQAAVPSLNPVQHVAVAEPNVTVQQSATSLCAAKFSVPPDRNELLLHHHYQHALMYQFNRVLQN